MCVVGRGPGTTFGTSAWAAVPGATQHPMILNSTRRSSESLTSSVPVPMMFSRDPTPLVLVLGANSADTWEKAHLADLDNAALKKGLKTVWFATGVNDGLIANSKATVEMLKKHGFPAEFKETPGAHTWINWRIYLNDFTPLLFQ